ncbi:MAG: hypothetical protein VYC42_01625 [Pseudomonadota bacterium]|nr:hypothetical protein [Pseudomonadota bacterium]
MTQEKEDGEKAGERWATESAEYDQLRRLHAQYGESRVDVFFDHERVFEVIEDDGTPLRDELHGFWERWASSKVLPSDEFCEGFVDGALKIFDRL